MDQKLRGFVGQNMRGRRPKPVLDTELVQSGTTNWTCPRSGFYRFVLWGCGAGAVGGFGGGSGGYVEKVAYVARGQVVAIFVPKQAASGACTVTLPTGLLLSAGSASNGGTGAGGAASGGDINIAGSNGTAAGSGTPGGNGGGTAGGVGASDIGAGGAGGSPGRITNVGTFRGSDGNSVGIGAGGNSLQGGVALVVIVRQNDSIA
jgi:hypothetical protein